MQLLQIFGTFLVAVIIAVIQSKPAHFIHEGYVGVYWRGGALLPHTAEAGVRYMIPVLDTMEQVQVSTQTDSVSSIPCGTSGGVMVNIARIEVVNRLRKDHVLQTIRNYGVHYDKIWIFDKIHHEINQFCSKHTLHEVYIEKFDALDEMLANKLQTDCDKYDIGIDIISIRVTKPTIPDSIKKTFAQLEEAKQELLLKKEQQRLMEAEQVIVLQQAKAKAEQNKQVRKIQLEVELLEEESKKSIQLVRDTMKSESIKAMADAEAYSIRVVAEAEATRLSKAKLQEVLYTSLSNNTKMYFGESIPKFWMDLNQFFDKNSKQ
eukprot:TRINITY_DN1350_c0_g1_i1.p2 TRINITY_DN1350_c0_g1~~TRINITY_DN1350_c0_g1_i1.p2  ORF type:complete len:320 (+),score=89.40 TRINITY_DN1350_c0_g1_i1:1128-2087(+)